MKQNNLKFRQPIIDKNRKFKEWYYWGDIGGNDWYDAATQMHGKQTKKLSQQITTFKDNHGNDIYVGDYVQTYCYNKKQKHEVISVRGEYLAGGYKLDAIYFTGAGKDFEVVGHIYENKKVI